MNPTEIIETALSLLYEKKWNLKKRKAAFALLRDFFDERQLEIIRKGYQSGLSRDRLKVLMYPGYTWLQMLIIESVLHKFSLQEALWVANPTLEVPQMQLMAEAIRLGLSRDQLCFLIQHKHNLIDMKIILGAFQHGVTEAELWQCYREIKNRD